MDNLRGQGGIQVLLTAEQEAGRIVSAARTAKLARMKQAKDEAEKEVEEYKTRLEEEYQAQLTGTDQEAAVKKLDEETEARIKNLKDSSSKVSKEVVKMLLKYVTATGA